MGASLRPTPGRASEWQRPSLRSALPYITTLLGAVMGSVFAMSAFGPVSVVALAVTLAVMVFAVVYHLR